MLPCPERLVGACVCCTCSFTLFQKRKPGGQNQWSEKLPDFVKRLEAALFNSAATKVRRASDERARREQPVLHIMHGCLPPCLPWPGHSKQESPPSLQRASGVLLLCWTSCPLLLLKWTCFRLFMCAGGVQ